MIKFIRENTIAIMNQISIVVIVGQGLAYLLNCPRQGWVGRDVDVDKRRVACSTKTNTYKTLKLTLTTVRKSQAMIPLD